MKTVLLIGAAIVALHTDHPAKAPPAMKITIETVAQSEQRYATLGDYWRDPDGTLHIRVTKFGPANQHYAKLIALHELVEVLLTEDRGIAEPAIMGFDIAHPELDDPGSDSRAPYHKEHMFAESLERQFARELGVDWAQYERDCRTVFGP